MSREGRRCPREKKQIPPNPLGSVFRRAALAQVFTWFGSGLKSFVSLEERAGCHHRQPRREPQLPSTLTAAETGSAVTPSERDSS